MSSSDDESLNSIKNTGKRKRKLVETDSDTENFDNKINTTESQSKRVCNYDICPICLCPLSSQKIFASPDSCDHIYCPDCLEEWSKNINTCPSDRKVYKFIILRDASNLKLIKKIAVKDRTQLNLDEGEYDLTYCEVCHMANNEDRMLLCDSCDKGYHCECLSPRLDRIPEGDWFCPECARQSNSNNRNLPQTSTQASSFFNRSSQTRRVIARTDFSERVRRRVNENRTLRSNLPIIYYNEHNDNEDETTVQTNEAKPTTSRASSSLNKRLALIRKRTTKKRTRRKKVRRRRKTTKRRKTKKKSDSLVKKLAGTDKLCENKNSATRKVKSSRKKRRKRRVKRKINRRTPRFRNYYLFKKKIRLSNKTPKERIIKKIIETDQNLKEQKIISTQEQLTLNHYNFSLLDKDNESFVPDNPIVNKFGSFSTSNPTTSSEFVDSKQFRMPANNQNKTNSADILNSILSDQKLLLTNSSKVQVKTDGSISLIEKNHNKQAKSENRAENSSKAISLSKTTSNNHISSDSNSQQLRIKTELKESKSLPIKTEAEDRQTVNNISSSNINVKSEPAEPTLIYPNQSSIVEHELESSNGAKISKNINEKFESGLSNLILERIVEISKRTIRPFYSNKTINKDEYKHIMKRVVAKVKPHIKSLSMISEDRIAKLVVSYVKRVKLSGLENKEDSN